MESAFVLGGKYCIDAVIGRGGMSVVHRATQLALDRPVALKLLYATNQQAFDTVAREAHAAASLHGEHIVRVFDVGGTVGQAWVVMELLEGIDLSELIRRHGALPVPVAAELGLQVCEALAEAHATAIVHRDLKPSNLFLTRRANGTTCLKVLDFGLVQRIGRPQDGVVGSAGYASPEQLEAHGGIDARADIWSLGAVLYEMVTGRRAYDVHDLVSSRSAVTKPPPPTGIANAAFEAVVRRCLERLPTRRYQSATELAEALAVFAPAHASDYVGRVAALAPERTSLAPVAVTPSTIVDVGLDEASRVITKISTITKRAAKKAPFRVGVMTAALAIVPMIAIPSFAVRAAFGHRAQAVSVDEPPALRDPPPMPVPPPAPAVEAPVAPAASASASAHPARRPIASPSPKKRASTKRR